MSDLVSKVRGVRKKVSVRADYGFTVEKRAHFLDALAATCNISKAAAYAGIASTTVYRTRAKDPVFADQWRDAMAIGFDRLEALVLEHGGAGEAIEFDPARAEMDPATCAPFDFDRAMTVLRYARGARDGAPNRRTGRPQINATRAETNVALATALKAIARHTAHGARQPGTA